MAQRIPLQLALTLWLLLVLAPLRQEAAKLTDAAAATDRQFILIFDAGSTGTRLIVFEFRLDSNHSTGLQIISMKEKKSSAGMSTFANAPDGLHSDLKPLMEFANASVPADLQARTTAIVRATAGLRVLTQKEQSGIIRVVAKVLRRSAFNVPKLDSQAVRIISGQEEAEYGWVAVNFLMDTFAQPGGDTYGMLDLGGGSTQITFVPRVDDLGDINRVVFKTVRGRSYALHEHSYLGLGRSQALLYIFGHNETGPPLPLYISPCLSPRFTGNFQFGQVSIRVSGDQNVMDSNRLGLCSALARIPLEKVPVHQPPSVKVAKFVAISSFYFTASLLRKSGFLKRKIPGEATINDLASAAVRVCANPADSGNYEPYLCMSTLYVVALLRDGYRFSDNQTLFITENINGYSASWPLGLAIHHLTCHDSSGHACLTSAAASVGGRSVGLWWVLVAACVSVLMTLSLRSSL